MSYFYIITLFAGLILSACGDTTTATETASVTENTTAKANPPQEAETTNEAEATNYDQERKVINDFVDQVNRDLAQLTLKETQKEMNGNTYDILHYTNAEGVLLKAKAVCDADSWEIYAHPAARGPQKRVYASYMAKTDNPYEPISKQYYHIGSMEQRDKALILVLNEAVEPMSGENRETWLNKYKDAAVVVTQK